MATYRSVLARPEFRALLSASVVGIFGQVLTGLALATLVFERTHSPAIAAFCMFGPALAGALGAVTLISAGDRLPPRSATVLLSLGTAATTLGFIAPTIAVVPIIVLVVVSGLLSSVGSSVRWGLLSEALPDDEYIIGRSLMQISTSVIQVAGNAGAAALLFTLSARGVLAISVAAHVLSALIALIGFSQRKPRAEGAPSITATWQVNRLLWRIPGVPAVYLAMWVPNGFIVGAEALFVPYAGTSAGLLFAAASIGMVGGDIFVARIASPMMRQRLITPIRLLLALPYLLFAFSMPIGPAIAVVLIASVGFGAGLILQERLVDRTPATLRGQALGLHTSGMFAFQGIGALFAGGLAEVVGVNPAMATVAALSVLITILLTRPLRSSNVVKDS